MPESVKVPASIKELVGDVNIGTPNDKDYFLFDVASGKWHPVTVQGLKTTDSPTFAGLTLTPTPTDIRGKWIITSSVGSNGNSADIGTIFTISTTVSGSNVVLHSDVTVTVLFGNTFNSLAFTGPSNSITGGPWTHDSTTRVSWDGTVVLNEYTSMTIPAFWRGVQWLSRTLAALPKNVVKKSVYESKGVQLLDVRKDYNHYLDYILNDEANDLQTSLQFWECIVHHAIVWGNGYGLVVREDDGVTVKAIYLLPPDRVIPFRWAGKQWYALQMIYDYQRPQAQWRAVEASNILHLPGFGFDGMRGYPVVQLFANNLRLGKSAEVFGEKYFSSGGNIGLTIETDMTLTPDQRQDLAQQIRDKHTGLDRAHEALILQRGLKAKNLTQPQDTAQYLQTRQFSILDIARILGVEPFILYDYTGAKFDNLELMGNAAVSYSLDPWMKTIQAECSRKLLNTDEKRVQRLKIQLDTNDLTRGDPTQQATNTTARLLSGQSNVNRELAIQGQPLNGPEGDTFHTSVQLQAPKTPEPGARKERPRRGAPRV